MNKKIQQIEKIQRKTKKKKNKISPTLKNKLQYQTIFQQF